MIREKLWYKNAIIYQLHVKCFKDSNGDGIGDFKGLAEKLDYIQNLGCTAIWIQPFYPSPLKDDGYDIADYCNIHEDYGTLKDFKRFLNEAHKRNLKVITELVINHTSDQHAWFQRARRAKPGSKYRNYYIWSDSPDKYSEARIIFKDFETSNWAWDPIANAYYWHRFYTCQPDLNYESLDVHEEIFRIVDFWMEMGVDGMRLDAIPYLYNKEDTDCENLEETHQYLKKLRAYVDTKYDNRMLLAEANQWPEQAATYFGNEDECHMAYHFPVMPRLFMAIKMEDYFPIIDIMEQTPLAPETCQWAMFLRNHDELTLEMVTDEERDYMYRVYAKDPEARINLGIRRRLSPLLGNDRLKIELMNVLLFSLPGSPIIYYGDEIGMGDNYYLGDRNGVRTPMQWDISTNAGFSECNPQKLYLPLIIDPEYHHEYLNVRNQDQNESSLLRWMRTIISVRHQYQAFGKGTLRFIHSSNSKVLVFLREFEEERILVVANLSRNSQHIEVSLEEFTGVQPIDVFSLNEFSRIKEGSFSLTLGRYGYYWLLLNKSKAQIIQEERSIQELTVKGNWDEIFEINSKKTMNKKILPEYLMECRWFRGKTKGIEKVEINDALKSDDYYFMILEVTEKDGTVENYFLPVTLVSLEEGIHLNSQYPNAIVCKIFYDSKEGYLIDALYDKKLHLQLMYRLIHRKKINHSISQIKFNSSSKLKKLVSLENLKSEVIKGEQSNTSIIFSDSIILKIFRKIDEGINPDHELSKYLSQDLEFKNVPAFLGVIEKSIHGKVSTIGTLQSFVPNSTDGWSYTQNYLDNYFTNASLHQIDPSKFMNNKDYFNEENISEYVINEIGHIYFNLITLLAERTAEMHLLLSQPNEIKEIKPEPFTLFYQKSLFQTMRGQQKKTFSQLKNCYHSFDEINRALAEKVLNCEEQINKIYKKIIDRKLCINKIRNHGDYHLGQILVTGKDIMIIDFEGEPTLTLSERKLKKCIFQDLAGMVRSFHYAATIALSKHKMISTESFENLEALANLWYRVISTHFIKTYIKTLGKDNRLLPEKIEDIRILLEAYLIHKAIYELNYELNTRPEWVSIPLKGILMITDEIIHA